MYERSRRAQKKLLRVQDDAVQHSGEEGRSAEKNTDKAKKDMRKKAAAIKKMKAMRSRKNKEKQE